MTTLTHQPWCTRHTDDPDGGLCATDLRGHRLPRAIRQDNDSCGDTYTVTASFGRLSGDTGVSPDERRVIVDSDMGDLSPREARELGQLLLRAADLLDQEQLA